MAHAGASPHWEKLWGAGLGKGQAFDVGTVSPTLAGELARMKAPRSGLSVLVPGCGRAYDALALARHGFDAVVAVDLSQTACDAAQAEVAAFEDKEVASKVSIQCADFFELEGQYDLVWDCTFLCALDPSVRQQWAEKYTALLSRDGTLLTCVFPICDKEGGPPYAMSVPLVRELLEPCGFKALRVSDPVPQQERHTVGGMRSSSGGPGTALVSWGLANSDKAE